MRHPNEVKVKPWSHSVLKIYIQYFEQTQLVWKDIIELLLSTHNLEFQLLNDLISVTGRRSAQNQALMPANLDNLLSHYCVFLGSEQAAFFCR